MTINEELINRKITISSKKRETCDLVTIDELKQIIENKALFENLYQQFALTAICTTDDYYNYLLARKIISLDTFITDLLYQEHKALLHNIITEAKDTISKIKKGDVIKFINKSYQSLLNRSIVPYGITEVFDVTIDLIVEYISGISYEVKKYLFQKLGKIVILHYNEFECVLKKNPELFDDLFSQHSLEYIQKYSFQDVLNVFTLYSKPESPHYSKVESIIKSLSNDIESLSKSLNVNNVMRYEHTIRSYIAFLRKIQHVDANRFEFVLRNLDKLLEQAISQNDNIFFTQIPISHIKATLTSKQPTLQKILSITHTLDTKTSDWVSKLDFPPENEDPLIKIASTKTNITTNEYFTFSHQIKLDFIIKNGAATIQSIFTDKSIINEYLNGYYDMIDYIATETHYDICELSSDYELLAQMMGNIFSLPKDADKILVHSLCYGAAVFLCAFSEKILRLCFFEDMKNCIYIPLNKGTIGSLLADNNTAMVKILGEYQVKHLNYFLGQDKDGMVGKSYRNRLAHWSEITDKHLTPMFVCQLFYLFACLITSIKLYYDRRNNDSNINNQNANELE